VRRTAEAILVAGLLAAPSPRARANGAFPDSQSVITPSDRPAEIILATNFGLVISEDAGQSWQWSCERDANAYGILYQQGPAPLHRLFTVAGDKLVFSDDGSCGWQTAAGALAPQLVTDAFPDPSDADHVLAIGYDGGIFGVFPSRDGGATFDGPLYEAAAGDGIGGVEIARSDARVIYVAMTNAASSMPKLARSGDGGASWTVTDLGPMLGLGVARIIAVDPADPNTVLLRVMGSDGQSIALTRDGGATVTVSLSIAGTFTSYVQLANGTRLVGALVESSTTPALYRSHDGGATFETVAGPPAIRALSRRGDVVYAATDNFAVGYALGVSTDEGTTWRAGMAYDQVRAILGCVRDDPQCQASCQALAGRGAMPPGTIWDAAVCSANPLPEPPTPLPEPPAMTGGGGCGCATVETGSSLAVVPFLFLFLGLVLAVASRRRA
jgi:MYXO-CTERM domain-containing protein